GAELPLPLETLYHRELTLTATYSSSPTDLAEAHALVTAGAVVVEPLITHRLPLSEVARGVGLMLRREALKVFVVPDGVWPTPPRTARRRRSEPRVGRCRRGRARAAGGRGA